jgi:hypothetical protein
MTDASHVLKRIKKCTEYLTSDVAYMLQHIHQFSLVFHHPASFLERSDEHQLKMIATQETAVRLTELIMEIRKELIAMGVTYEEATEEVSSLPETQD